MQDIYADIERNPDGTFTVFNNVTGQPVKTCATFAQARGEADLLRKHYAGLAKESGWIK